ncbi:ribosome biogenesis protein tsr1 [Balamuthia mandrillaris]
MQGGTVHRAGPMKQVNKPFKSGKHASKGELRRKTKGKVSVKAATRPVSSNVSRKNVARQRSKQKKQEVLFSKMLGTNAGPPKIVALVALGEGIDLNATRRKLLSDLDRGTQGATTVIFPDFKQRMTFFEAAREQDHVLDVCKTADIVVFVIPAESGVDALGEYFISIIKAQGLPSVLVAVQGLAALPQKKYTPTKKQLKDYVQFHFPDTPKLLPLDTPQDGVQVVRFLSNIRVKQLGWREGRPYVLVDSLSFTPNPDDNSKGVLSASGYLRGGSLSANHLVHVPDFGDFQLVQLEEPQDPNPFAQHSASGMDVNNNQAPVVLRPDEGQESLQSEVEPDVMANEQNWGEEDEAELKLAEALQKKKRKRRVPKGTSEYQAAWILDSDDEAEEAQNEDEEDEEEEEEEEEEPVMDMNEAGASTIQMDGMHEDFNEESDYDEEEDQSNFGDEDEEEERREVDPEAAQHELEEIQRKKKEEETEDMEFPDEVQTPEHTPAKIRFQKYRGLRSFRNSPWDSKENLPLDYARIFQFKNFARTQKKVLEEHDGVAPGTYITVHIKDVPSTITSTVSATKPFVLSGLFKHEHKKSVLNFAVQRHGSYTLPIKSKDRLVFQFGFRRFVVRPIFSENTASDKHKFERFFRLNRSSMATIYGPVVFPPCPLLIFTPPTNTPTMEGPAFVGSGSLHSVDPDRLVIKKIVLSGFPIRVRKRTATIKHMFYFPDDIRWFKPVELWTKHGRVGHIKEPLGTHGLFKCVFDGKIMNHDTVCMSLYKRVFPKWNQTKLLSDRSALVEEENSSAAAASSSAGSSSLTAANLAAFVSMQQ